MNDSADEPPLLHRIRSWLPARSRHPRNRPGPAGHEHDSASTLSPHSRLSPQPRPSQRRHASTRSTISTPLGDRSSDGQGLQSNPGPALEDNKNLPLSPPAPPPMAEKGEGEESSSINPKHNKASLRTRFLNDCKRIIFCSWINWLLIFVPIGIAFGAVERAQGDRSPIIPTVVFSMNALAIIPLASLLAYATESVATKMGDTIGALLNVTFGNAVELIVFIIALVANQIKIVQAAALGSILSNLLLILGMCFLFGGLRFREQLYNPAVSQMSACLLSLSVVSLLLPTAFHASFSNRNLADRVVLKVSRGTSVVLLCVYVLYLLFQLKSHAYMYQSTPQHLIDEESHPGVLADMLNSSSSSSDSTSSSDSESDSSSGSHTTAKRAKRIKRALRRKRRKSSVNSDDTFSVPSTQQASSPLSNMFTGEAAGIRSARPHWPRPSHSLEAMISGDEADAGRSRRRSRRRSTGITSRDFEMERTGSADDAVNTNHRNKKKFKRSKKSNTEKAKMEGTQTTHGAEGKELDGNRVGRGPSTSARSASTAPPQVNIITADQEAVSDPAPRKSFHFRELSLTALPRSISPALFSQQSTGSTTSTSGMLGVPQADSNLRRTTSMPEMGNNNSSPNMGPVSAQPLPHLMPSNQHIAVIDPKLSAGQEPLSRTSAMLLLLVVTGLVAVCAEFLVRSIDYMVKETGVSQAFIGLIILPMVGNAAEHVTAVTVASKNKMDLAIGVALGSSIQIAIFVTPLIVLLGWCLGRDMSLHFSLFETISLFASAFIVNYLMIDGRSNYLEGALLLAAYVIIALAAFFYPSCENLSEAGGLVEGTCP